MSVSTPALCPKNLGMYRFFAQRPLPSMTTATCLGILGLRSIDQAVCRCSDGQHFGFLGLHQTVNFRDHAVGQALHVILAPTLIIF